MTLRQANKVLSKRTETENDVTHPCVLSSADVRSQFSVSVASTHANKEKEIFYHKLISLRLFPFI